MDDLYRILQLDMTATSTDVKKSYQELALKYHPDKTNSHVAGNPPAEMFIKVNRAYRILSDPELRRQYDVKWQERCLAQAFPIQDIVDFEDFEEAELQNDANGENNTNKAQAELIETNRSINSDEMKQCKAEGNDKASVISVTGDNCVNIKSGEHGTIDDNRSLCEMDKSKDMSKHSRITKGDPLIDSNSIPDSDEDRSSISIENVDENLSSANNDSIQTPHEVVYLYECRCGGNYILTKVDVKLKFDIVCCDSCSLSVKVNYTDEDDEL